MVVTEEQALGFVTGLAVLLVVMLVVSFWDGDYPNFKD